MGLEVWRISMRGSRPSWIACWVSEKAPVMTAWLAMTVAAVARTTQRASRPIPAIMRKNGLSAAVGSQHDSAPWPR